jgi:ABC-type uncharacterized transport system permease subunit
MEIYAMFAAALYIGCAAIPSERRSLIASGILLAWLVHGMALAGEVLMPHSLRLGFATVLSSALWVSVAIYWVENRNLSLDSLRVLVLPTAAVLALLPLVFPGSVISMEGKSSLFSWHIAIAILAYSTLTIAAFHAVLMALQEAKLHTRAGLVNKGWFAASLDRLPALLTMEKLLFRMIGIGFFFLTLTVLSGIFFSEQLFGKSWRWDHKTVFTVLSWFMFGALLAGRFWRGWRGKTALRFMLTGFVTLLLAYVGSRFVLEVVLHRGFA